MNRDIQLGNPARQGLKDGVDKLANAVKVTLGAKGRNVAYKDAFGNSRVTKDGVTVAKETELADELESMGANMIKTVAVRTGDDAGDGTTTATVIAQALVNEAFKVVAAGANPMDIKRGMDSAVSAVVAFLKEESSEVNDTATVQNVAAISANNDNEIGDLIAEAFSKIGKTGVITVEESRGVSTYIEVVNGMKVDKGFASTPFITNADKEEAVLDNPLVLIYNGKIESMVEFLPTLEPIAKAGRSLLLITDDIDGELLSSPVVNKLRANLKIVVVKSPEFGDFRKDVLGDIAVFTGGEVVSDSVGVSIGSVPEAMFGNAEKVIVKKDSTIILAGSYDDDKMAERSGMLQKNIQEAEVPQIKDKARKRLAQLNGGVAVLHVGASSEVELKEKIDRVDDAVQATRAAIEEGIVAGGGVTLLKAKSALKGLKSANHDEAIGIDIVRKALEAPIRTILDNAGLEPSVIIDKIQSSRKPIGFNVRTSRYVNMIEEGIIDPKKVTRVALESAASVAGMIVITECALVNVSS